MKKIVRIALSALTVLLLIISLTSLAFAADGLTISLRVEGIDKCLYNDVYTYDTDGSSAKLADVLLALDAADDDITMVGVSDNFVSSINGLASPYYGGWDGWMYRVNGVEAPVGVKDMDVKNGDSVVFYYADVFGVGFQVPEIAENEGGVIKFTSSDVTYDANGVPSTSVNPVAGMKVTLSGAGVERDFVTDENGVVDASSLPDGRYAVTVSRYADNGCPTVLRFETGAVIIPIFRETDEKTDAAPEQTQPAVSDEPTDAVATQPDSDRSPVDDAATDAVVPADGAVKNPATGERMTLVIALLVIVIAVVAIVLSTVLKKKSPASRRDDKDEQ